MRVLGTDVRREILNTTYPALYIVMFSIMEGESPTIEKTQGPQRQGMAYLRTFVTNKSADC